MADSTVTPEVQKSFVYGVTDIMKFLPHRYPFLLVDRIIEVDADKRIVGLRT